MLAIELSTRVGSAVLFDGRRVIVGERWEDAQSRHQQVFAEVHRMMVQAGVRWTDVKAYAAGRGPGAFSGNRVALTAVQALALPGGQPVYAISSGDALAAQRFALGAPESVAIAGDARRGAAWYRLFQPTRGGHAPATDWEVVPSAAIIDRLPLGCSVFCSDYERMSKICPVRDPRLRWHPGDVFPEAEWIARLAWQRMESKEPSDPLQPLYLHPPV